LIQTRDHSLQSIVTRKTVKVISSRRTSSNSWPSSDRQQLLLECLDKLCTEGTKSDTALGPGFWRGWPFHNSSTTALKGTRGPTNLSYLSAINLLQNPQLMLRSTSSGSARWCIWRWQLFDFLTYWQLEAESAHLLQYWICKSFTISVWKRTAPYHTLRVGWRKGNDKTSLASISTQSHMAKTSPKELPSLSSQAFQQLQHGT